MQAQGKVNTTPGKKHVPELRHVIYFNFLSILSHIKLVNS
jgi:hypothetical protein